MTPSLLTPGPTTVRWLLGGEEWPGGYRGAPREQGDDALPGYLRAEPRDPAPGVIKRAACRGSRSLLPFAPCRPRPPPPHFRRGCGRGGARAGAGGGGIGWARPAVRAAGRLPSLSLRSRGPCVPQASWAIATRWGPTRRWWFQVRGQRGRWSGQPVLGGCLGARAGSGKVGEEGARGACRAAERTGKG